MMGDRDYRSLIRRVIDAIGKEIEINIDVSDNDKIGIHEITGCIRRAYFNRIDPLEYKHQNFGELSVGLLHKLHYGTKKIEFDMDGIKLIGNADMIIDDAIIIFRSTIKTMENPLAADMIYLNACLWMYNKNDGIIVYITTDGQESSFSLTRNKSMFEETARRVRILHNLLVEKKLPILEPSSECSTCQYYQRCYMKQKIGKTITISDIMGMKK
ncbi:MAG: hypothetical protein K8823_171 [Cenarchaeum symbiont of Oopsacas minuta]|nr:hypothetical protein [Cenarchaeum symbiont of Oopsacas minuta]